MKKKWNLAFIIIGLTLFFALIRGGYYVGKTEGYTQGVNDGIDSMDVIYKEDRKADALRLIERNKQMDSLFDVCKGIQAELEFKIDSVEKLKP